MTIHVFVGAGPANLHRALKVANTDPHAKIVLIDNRFNAQTHDFERERARANIFLIDKDTAQNLINDGVREEDWDRVVYKRDFGLEKEMPNANQAQVPPSPKRFHMIQIRDLQELFLNTLRRLFQTRPQQLFILPTTVNEDSSLSGDKAISDRVMQLIKDNHIPFEEEQSNIHIHFAPGALTQNDAKDTIIYPAKSSAKHGIAASDLESMPIVPRHVTCTFRINEHEVTCERLEDIQQALNKTLWKPVLEEFDWTLARPPAVRVFYANGVLYIGAEVPDKIANIPNRQERERDTVLYTQAILSLMFPNLPINALIANRGSGIEFETQRGERGKIRSTYSEKVDDHQANITVLHHSDDRYLPHYQTASGFIMATMNNQLYVDIYRHQTFHDLYMWAKEKKLVNKDEHVVLAQYQKLTHGHDSALILEAFKAELLNAGTRDVIDANKERVGNYFKSLHAEELTYMATDLTDLLALYNRHQRLALTKQNFQTSDERAIIVDLLKTNNILFLREALPLTLNKDISMLSDDEVMTLRDAHVSDYERLFITKPAIYSDKFTKYLVTLSDHNADDLVRIAEQIALYLEQNKALHHRAALSFFKGQHSDTIHSFAKKIKGIQSNSTLENPKKEIMHALTDFHQKLLAGHSKRTMHALETAVELLETNLKAYAAKNIS